MLGSHWRSKELSQRRTFMQAETRDLDALLRRWQWSKTFGRQVASEQRFDCLVLRGGSARLIENCVVVVAGDVRLIRTAVGIVGARAETERRAPVQHIEA